MSDLGPSAHPEACWDHSLAAVGRPGVPLSLLVEEARIPGLSRWQGHALVLWSLVVAFCGACGEAAYPFEVGCRHSLGMSWDELRTTSKGAEVFPDGPVEALKDIAGDYCIHWTAVGGAEPDRYLRVAIEVEPLLSELVRAEVASDSGEICSAELPVRVYATAADGEGGLLSYSGIPTRVEAFFDAYGPLQSVLQLYFLADDREYGPRLFFDEGGLLTSVRLDVALADVALPDWKFPRGDAYSVTSHLCDHLMLEWAER